MDEIARFEIPLSPGDRPISLAWLRDDLVDWVNGRTTCRLNGGLCVRPFSMGRFTYRFDRAQTGPGGEHFAVFENLGTKGVLGRRDDARGLQVLREIDRSFYCANAYEYPIALLNIPDCPPLIVHCPDSYCRLECENLVSGECLTRRDTEPADFFHSRLQTHPRGQHVLDAGWVWHPADWIKLFDMREALRCPSYLDGRGDPAFQEALESRFGLQWDDHVSGAFLDPGTLVVASARDVDPPDDAPEPKDLILTPGNVGRYHIASGAFDSVATLEEVAGELMPVEGHVVGFYDHPKLVELATGQVLRRWPELNTGRKVSSIIGGLGPQPLVCPDVEGRRFAVVGDDKITVIQLG